MSMGARESGLNLYTYGSGVPQKLYIFIIDLSGDPVL